MNQFSIIRAEHLHPPYGLYIVSHAGVVIGRQLSYPSHDDCERMLRERCGQQRVVAFAPVAVSYHKGGVEATRRSQRRGGYHKRGKRKAA